MVVDTGTVDNAQLHTGFVIASHNGIDVIRCNECGYAHQYPLPSQAEVDKYYQEDQFYNTHSPNQWFIINQAEHKAGLWNAQYRRQQDMLLAKWQTLIDIGAGDGWFLENWRMRGGHGVGIEPSKTARQLSHNVIMYPDTKTYWQRRKYAEYDQCTRAALVLEHVSDTWGFMRDIYRLTGPCGKIMLVVPNESNPLQNKIRKQLGYDWFVQKPHLNYFDKQSIANFVNKWGFRVTKQTGTFPMELFWLMGYKYIGDDAIGQKVHTWRLNFESKYKGYAFKLYDWWYKWFGWGRETIIVGEKK